jgi:large subunit ribosomal protein L30e
MMVMDINTALKRIIETGKVNIGTEKALKDVANGKAKVVIMANNCPKKNKERIEKSVQAKGVELIRYKGTALQLGEACGKPFLVAALSITDVGNTPLGELKT